MRFSPDSLIQFSLEKMRQQLQAGEQQGGAGRIRSGLVYAGNIQDAIPRQLLLDSRLSPVDKLTWMMIRLHASQNDGAVFPTYDELQLLLATPHSHKASRETVSRALLMLRLTGWLSLCNRVRDSRGRVRGNIYMQHDEPLTAWDAETLDPRWLDLLEKSCQHKSKSVRHVARATIREIQNDPTMRHQHTRLALIEQRLGVVQTPAQLAGLQRLILDNADEGKKNRTVRNKAVTPGPKIELSQEKGAEIPGSKIELSGQSLISPAVRKSNHNNVRSFTQSVKDTYVDKPEENNTLFSDTVRRSLPADDVMMLESQLRQLPSDLAHAIASQLAQGLENGDVRNPVAYTLTLLKSARNGRYRPVTQVKTDDKKRSSGDVLLRKSGTAGCQRTEQPPAARKEADPKKVRQAITEIRQRLLGFRMDQHSA